MRHKSFKIEDIDKFKQSLHANDELAFEATGNSTWFYRECRDLVSRIVVVNTSEFGVIANSVKKTDKNDAKNFLKENLSFIEQISLKDREKDIKTIKSFLKEDISIDELDEKIHNLIEIKLKGLTPKNIKIFKIIQYNI